MMHLRDLLCSDFYCMLFLAAVVQRGAIHVLVVQRGQLLHLLPDPCDFVLDLKRKWTAIKITLQVQRGFGSEDSKQSVHKGSTRPCYFTSSTPSIHLGGSFLVTPIAASGSKLIPDTRAIRSSASFKTQKTLSSYLK